MNVKNASISLLQLSPMINVILNDHNTRSTICIFGKLEAKPIIRKRCTVHLFKPLSPVLAQVRPAFSDFERARRENSGRLRERIALSDN